MLSAVKFYSILAIAMVMTAAGSVRAQVACHGTHTGRSQAQLMGEISEQEASLARIRIQHFLENAVQFLQKKVTVRSVRSSQSQMKQRQAYLEYLLKQGRSFEAIDLYRRTFDNVELSFHLISLSKKQLDQLPATSAERKRVQKRLTRAEQLFAQGYGEYVSTRSFLEELIQSTAADALTQKTAQQTYRLLSVHKFSESHKDFAALQVPSERPELAEIKKLFRSDARYVRIKLWGDFKSEVLTGIKYFASSEALMQMVNSTISLFPPAAADRLKTFTGLIRSGQLRTRLLPDLIEIESLPENPRLRLNELRSRNSRTVDDDLLVVFARTVELTDSWIQLKAEAQLIAQESQAPIHQEFYQRLLKAEARALKLPDISLWELTSNVDLFYSVVQAGVVLKMTWPAVADKFDILQVLSGLPF